MPLKLTLGNYQRGITLPTLYRYRDSHSPSGFRIVTGQRKINGTGIPASVLSRFESGRFIPSDASLKKIVDFEARVKYALLRASGVSATEAAISKRYSFSEVHHISDTFRSQAIRHAEDTVKQSWLTDHGVPENIAVLAPDLSRADVKKMIKEYGDKPAGRFPSEAVSKMALYIMAGFSHSTLQISDIEDIYGESDESADPVDELNTLYDAGNIFEGGDFDEDE